MSFELPKTVQVATSDLRNFVGSHLCNFLTSVFPDFKYAAKLLFDENSKKLAQLQNVRLCSSRLLSTTSSYYFEDKCSDMYIMTRFVNQLHFFQIFGLTLNVYKSTLK